MNEKKSEFSLQTASNSLAGIHAHLPFGAVIHI